MKTLTLPLPAAKPLCSAFVHELDDINFDEIAYFLTDPNQGLGWNLTKATQGINAYRRFLLLKYLYPTEELIPSEDVEQVWRSHILNTRKYRSDCYQLFGYYLDYFPYDSTYSNALSRTEAWHKTQALYLRHFQDFLQK